MSQENLKSFKLQGKTDFIVYLRELIMYTYKHLKDFKRYIDELDRIIEERGLRNNKAKRIPRDLYTDINYRILGVESHLMNIVGDLTNTGMSYNKFRKLADKRQSNVCDLGLDALKEEIANAITDVNIARNWGLHVPESLLTAQLEIRTKIMDLHPGEYFPIPDNPILITEFIEYEGEWLISLYNEKSNSYNNLSAIFQQMKKDYSKLLGESMEIEKRSIEIRPVKDMDIPKISYQIQQKKFKGVDDDIFVY